MELSVGKLDWVKLSTFLTLELLSESLMNPPSVSKKIHVSFVFYKGNMGHGSFSETKVVQILVYIYLCKNI